MEMVNSLQREYKFSVPEAATSIVAQVFRGDTPVGPSLQIDNDEGLAVVELPFEAVSRDGVHKIAISFVMDSVNHSLTRYFEVATPYVDLWRLRELLPGMDSADLWAVESAVRHVINAYTGQSFNLEDSTITIQGRKDAVLRMPRPVISVSKITEGGRVVFDTSINDGQYHLGEYAYKIGEMSIRRRSGDDDYLPDNVQVYTNPIAPPGYAGLFKDTTYAVTGTFGYLAVPAGVRHAAELLIQDFACQDSIYQRKYIQSVSMVDWSFTMNNGAFAGTGNAMADSLLDEYKVSNMMVI